MFMIGAPLLKFLVQPRTILSIDPEYETPNKLNTHHHLLLPGNTGSKNGCDWKRPPDWRL